jgi:hypothetical protein
VCGGAELQTKLLEQLLELHSTPLHSLCIGGGAELQAQTLAKVKQERAVLQQTLEQATAETAIAQNKRKTQTRHSPFSVSSSFCFCFAVKRLREEETEKKTRGDALAEVAKKNKGLSLSRCSVSSPPLFLCCKQATSTLSFPKSTISS